MHYDWGYLGRDWHIERFKNCFLQWKHRYVFLFRICSPNKIKQLTMTTCFFYIFSPVVILMNLVMLFIPRYTHSTTTPTPSFCCAAILFQGVLFSSTFSLSWLAIIAWLVAGDGQVLFFPLTKKHGMNPIEWHQYPNSIFRYFDVHTMRTMLLC